MSSGEALEDAVDLDIQILCCGNLVRKAVQRVQIYMVKSGDQMFLCECIEVCEIADHSSSGIDRSTKCNLHGVVMAVPVRVVALAEDGLILGCVVSVGIEPVRGAEVVAAA